MPQIMVDKNHSWVNEKQTLKKTNIDQPKCKKKTAYILGTPF